MAHRCKELNNINEKQSLPLVLGLNRNQCGDHDDLSIQARTRTAYQTTDLFIAKPLALLC